MDGLRPCAEDPGRCRRSVTDEAAARRLAAEQHGVVAAASCASRASRPGGAQPDRLTTAGWPSPTRCCELTAAPRRLLRTFSAAVLDTGPGAVLSGLSAAHHWGLSGCPLTSRPAGAGPAARGGQPTLSTHPPQSGSSPTAGRRCIGGDRRLLRPELRRTPAVRVLHRSSAQNASSNGSGPTACSAALRSMALLDELGRRGRNGCAGLRTYLDARGVALHADGDRGSRPDCSRSCARRGLVFERQVDTGDDERGADGSTSGTSAAAGGRAAERRHHTVAH